MSRSWRRSGGLWLPEYGRPAGFAWRPPQRRMSSAAGTGVPTAPVITSVSPTTAQPGTVLTVSGVGFGSTQGTGGATIAGTTAPVDTWSDTTITATAPAQTSYPATAPVVVTTGSGSTTTSGQSVTTTTPTAPAIISLSATSGSPSSSLTLTGVDFGASQGAGTVTIDGVTATVTAWSDTSITATVPTQSVYPATGTVSVTTNGGQTATSSQTFTTNSPSVAGDGAGFSAAASQYLSIPSNSFVSLGGGSFAISLWVYPTASALMCLASQSNDTTASSWYFYYRASTAKFEFGGDTGLGAFNLPWSATSAINNWYLLMAWGDGTNINFNVNNGTPVVASGVGTLVVSSFDVTLGRQMSSGSPVYASARIDEMGLWKGRIFTSSERSTLYGGGAPPTWTTLSGTSLNDASAYWPLGEPAGSTRYDATGHGNNLTDHNNVAQVTGIA